MNNVHRLVICDHCSNSEVDVLCNECDNSNNYKHFVPADSIGKKIQERKDNDCEYK